MDMASIHGINCALLAWESDRERLGVAACVNALELPDIRLPWSE